MLLIPDTDLPAAGLLLHGLLIFLHLLEDGLPLAPDLLILGLFHQNPFPCLHCKPACELHLAGTSKPALDQALQLLIRMTDGEQLIAAMGQPDGEPPLLIGGLCLVESAIEGGVPLL